MAKAVKKTTKYAAPKKPKEGDEPEELDDEIEGDDADAPDEVQEPDEGEDAPEGPAGSPPATGSSHSVTVVGKGELSIMADGKGNAVKRGERIKVSEELLAALKAHGEQIEEH